MIFLDSNVPMYLTGAPHPRKTESQILTGRLLAAGERLVTDAEVLQELVHRYLSINRRDAVWPLIDTTLNLVDEVFPVELTDVLRAAQIVERPSPFSARDAIHLAIIKRYKIQRILSFDTDFDHWPGLERIHQV
jgi:uncharacterized protein